MTPTTRIGRDSWAPEAWSTAPPSRTRLQPLRGSAQPTRPTPRPIRIQPGRIEPGPVGFSQEKPTTVLISLAEVLRDDGDRVFRSQLTWMSGATVRLLSWWILSYSIGVRISRAVWRRCLLWKLSGCLRVSVELEVVGPPVQCPRVQIVDPYASAAAFFVGCHPDVAFSQPSNGPVLVPSSYMWDRPGRVDSYVVEVAVTGTVVVGCQGRLNVARSWPVENCPV